MWAIIERFDLFESWWAWLTGFRADDAGLVHGNVRHGTVVPPVPYRLRFDVRLERCDRPRLIEATIEGTCAGRRRCGLSRTVSTSTVLSGYGSW